MKPVPLFRAEAIAFQSAGAREGVALPMAPPLAAPGWLAVAFAVAAVIYVCTATYARKENAVGLLVPQGGVARIWPTRPGIVTEILVREGDRVVAGQRLMTIDAGEHARDGVATDAAVLDALRRQHEATERQETQERARAETEAARLRSRADGIEAELSAERAELDIQRARASIAAGDAQAGATLAARGNLSQPDQRRRADNALAQDQAVASLKREIAAKQGEAEEARAALALLPSESEARIAALQAAVSELDGRLAEAEGRRAYAILAPVAGVVSSLQAEIGQRADTQVPPMAIVPAGGSLQAELLVPARAAGFLREGQAVRLDCSAFPAQRFGFLPGQVVSVSHTLLRPAEVSGPVEPTEAVYRVIVALDRQSMRAWGQDQSLGADMSVRAEIVLDHRRLIAWMLAPLLARHAAETPILPMTRS